jgi:hypothetical protein
MTTTKLFQQIPNTLNNYKDTQVNQPSLAKTVFNNGTIVAMPKEIYQHLSKYSGCIFNNIQSIWYLLEKLRCSHRDPLWIC